MEPVERENGEVIVGELEDFQPRAVELGGQLRFGITLKVTEGNIQLAPEVWLRWDRQEHHPLGTQGTSHPCQHGIVIRDMLQAIKETDGVELLGKGQSPRIGQPYSGTRPGATGPEGFGKRVEPFRSDAVLDEVLQHHATAAPHVQKLWFRARGRVRMVERQDDLVAGSEPK